MCFYDFRVKGQAHFLASLQRAFVLRNRHEHAGLSFFKKAGLAGGKWKEVSEQRRCKRDLPEVIIL